MAEPPIIDDEPNDEPARYHPPGGSQAGGPIMNEPEFTPGPWIVSGKHPWIVQCPTNFPGIKGEIAKFGYKPNANICAAAPDMYEALQDALALANPDLDIPEDAHGRWKILARAALAKARGEA